MDAPQETPLELAQRRVCEAEARVASQRERIAELAREGREGRDTTQANAILGSFETTLRFMRQDLADCRKPAG
jgi:hypothetical protein